MSMKIVFEGTNTLMNHPLKLNNRHMLIFIALDRLFYVHKE